MNLNCLLAPLLLAINTVTAAADLPEKKSLSYLTLILTHLQGEKQDSSISFTEIKDSVNGPGLAVIFDQIPEKVPYKLEYQRLMQEDPSQFARAKEQEIVLNTVRGENFTPPFGVLLALNQYLPGERTTWRISTKDGKVLKQVTCCPKPLVIKNSSEELLMEAALISPAFPTCYILFFPKRSDDMEFVFTVGAKQTKGKIPKGDSKMTTFEPILEGSSGGVSKIELISKKKSYHLDLPWGDQLIPKIKRKNA